jgi:hypothetical protein
MTDNEITVRIHLSTVSDLDIHLYNVLGRNIKSLGSLRNVTGNFTETFSVNDIPKGIYFLAVIADNKKMVKKIMVE